MDQHKRVTCKLKPQLLFKINFFSSLQEEKKSGCPLVETK